MADTKKAAPAAPKASAKKAPSTDGKVIASSGDTELVMRDTAATSDRTPQKAGEAGPPSSLETGVGSPTGASAGGEQNYEGRRGEGESADKGAIAYSVAVYTDEDGVEVYEISAKSGDEAAQKALAKKNYKGASIRGVTPVSDPDPNSLGGERDASIMLHNAENPGAGANVWPGTEANAKAVKELGKADIEELGE
jgi:hypothetical protein